MPILLRSAPTVFVLLWATGFIGARYAMPWAEPFSFLAVRFSLVFALLWILVAILRRPPISTRDACHAALAGMLMHGVYLGGVFWAIRNGMPAGMSALIIGLQPLITAIMAGLFLGDRISRRVWIGLAIGFAGVVIVVFPKIGASIGGITLAALAANVIAAIGISAGTIWQKRFVSGADMIGGTLWQYAGGAALMALFSFFLETRAFTLTGELIFAMAWLVLVLSVGAVLLLMYLIREGEIARTASLFYLVPGVTAIMGWFLFGETLSLLQIAGIVIASIGVWFATSQPAMRARASR